MKIKFIRQYRKAATPTQPSKMVFVYGVTGTPEQLAEYKKVKGDKHIIDETTKMPLFFSTRFCGQEGSILENKEKTDWRIDTTEADQLANLANQYGAELALIMFNKSKEVSE